MANGAELTVRVAAIEFGGTKVLVAASRGAMLQRPLLRISTTSPAETLPRVVEAVSSLMRSEGPFEAIGVASFGPIELEASSADYGLIRNTPKPGWSGVNPIARLRQEFGVPVVLETDVNAAALAEGRRSAAGLSDYAYITVGTGVGVGLVVNGSLIHGAGHPEAGHLLVRPVKGDTFPGICPVHGACVEGMISGPALAERLGAGAAGEKLPPEVLALAADYLAQLCVSISLTTAPRRIIIGGGVGSRADLLEATRRRLPALLGNYLPRYASPEAAHAFLAPAELQHSGLQGAAELALAAAPSSPGRVSGGRAVPSAAAARAGGSP